MTISPRSTRSTRPGLLAALFLLTVLCGPVQADKVWLDNGNYLEGEARELASGEVEIASAAGTLRVPASRVERIERGQTAEQRIAAWLERNPSPSADRLFELALEAREAGAATLGRMLLERVIELDPDHEGARRLLGYRAHGDQWVTEAELHDLRGEVLFRGQWVSAETRARILEREADRDAANAQRRLEQAQLEQLLTERETRLQQQRRAGSAYGSGIPIWYVWTPTVTPLTPVTPIDPPHVPAPGAPRHDREAGGLQPLAPRVPLGPRVPSRATPPPEPLPTRPVGD